MTTENTQTNMKAKGNPWVIVSFILGVMVVIAVYIILRGGENATSGDKAGADIVTYLNEQTGGGVAYVSNKDMGNLYEITVSYQGQDIPVYITKDGKYLAQGVVLIAGDNSTVTPKPKEVPKSDKPKVEAFIFSYCPYGLQFEKALWPVYDLLKSKADINIVAIGAMHGEFEKTETLRQISIEQLYSRDKLFVYLKEFDSSVNISTCNGDAACLNKYLPAIYTKLGIDKTKVENYMKANAVTIYDAQVAEANSLGIGSSPTFVINGVEVQVSRNSDAIKQAVCDAFNTVPTECSQTLSTTSPGAGFGVAEGGSSSGAQC